MSVIDVKYLFGIQFSEEVYRNPVAGSRQNFSFYHFAKYSTTKKESSICSEYELKWLKKAKFTSKRERIFCLSGNEWETGQFQPVRFAYWQSFFHTKRLVTNEALRDDDTWVIQRWWNLNLKLRPASIRFSQNNVKGLVWMHRFSTELKTIPRTRSYHHYVRDSARTSTFAAHSVSSSCHGLVHEFPHRKLIKKMKLL